jgi:DNA-binding MarR family transcriptional regulator
MVMVLHPVGDELAASLRLAIVRLARRLRQEDTTTGATISQLSALGVINAHGPITLRDLSARERVQPPTMTRLVAALEADGLAVREGDPEDRRIVLLRTTSKGRKLLEDSRQRRTAFLVAGLASLTPGERRRLEAALPLLERLAQS